MVQWGPDTTPAAPHSGGYDHRDNHVEGFSLTHLSGAGCALYGDFPFLPTTEPIASSPAKPGGGLDGRFQPGFSHAEEAARPGLLPGPAQPRPRRRRRGRADVRRREPAWPASSSRPTRTPASSSTPAAAPSPTTSPRSKSTPVAVKSRAPPPAATSVVSARATGSTSPPSSTAASTRTGPGEGGSLERGGQIGRRQSGAGGESANDRPGRRLRLASTPATDRVVTAASASPSSASTAPAPTSPPKAGVPASTAIASRARKRWNQALGRVRVSGGPRRLRDTFYTALYHAFLAPRTFNDVGGAYLGMDGQIQRRGGRTQYADFSGWDIYRTQIQLLAMLAPERASEMIELAAGRRRAERLPAALVLRQRPEHDDGRRLRRPDHRLGSGLRRRCLRPAGGAGGDGQRRDGTVPQRQRRIPAAAGARLLPRSRLRPLRARHQDPQRQLALRRSRRRLGLGRDDPRVRGR